MKENKKVLLLVGMGLLSCGLIISYGVKAASNTGVLSASSAGNATSGVASVSTYSNTTSNTGVTTASSAHNNAVITPDFSGVLDNTATQNAEASASTQGNTSHNSSGEGTAGGNMCDLNNDGRIDVSDISRFQNECSITEGVNPKYFNQCDLNEDGKFDVFDINVFNDKCIGEGILGKDLGSSSDSNTEYSSELQEAYERAYSNGIISESPIEDANLYKALTNAEMADIMVKYSKYLGIIYNGEPASSCRFDRPPSVEESNFCLLYGLGRMDESLISFNDADIKATEATFGTALSRALWGNKYDGGTPYYKNHLEALKTAGIINQINNPENKNLIKGYMLNVLKNSSTYYNAECGRMGTRIPNISHVVNKDGTITLMWDTMKGDRIQYVQIAIFDSDQEVYKYLGTAKMADKKFDYKIQRNGEQNFMLSNSCGQSVFYKVDVNLSGGNICDFNKDGKINVSDVSRFQNECSITNGVNPKYFNQCDLNGDGKVNVSDLNIFTNKCIGEEILGKTPDTTTTGSSVNDQTTQEGNICDFNNDDKINVSDISRFQNECSITEGVNPKYFDQCDLNGDGKFDVFDINVFNDKCIGEGILGKTSDNNGSKIVSSLNNGYTAEQNKAYKFAHENGITTVSIDEAKMNSPLTRIAMAKMLSYYAINILGKKPDTSKGTPIFNDVTNQLNNQYKNAVTLSYQLGIMGQNMENNNFRPNDEVPRAELATALSRMLYGTTDGKGNTKYYEPHLTKLYNEGIISNTNPKLKEKRGYVMTMLMRTAE